MGTLLGSQVPNGHSFTDNVRYTMGTRFNPLVPISMTHFRWWVPVTGQPAGEPIQFVLWDNDTQTIMRQQSYDTAGHEDQRIEVELAGGPVSLSNTTPGDVGYTVSVFIPNYYVATSAFDWSTTDNRTEVICPQPAGFFAQHDSPAYPDGTFNSGNYFADIVYELGDETPTGPTFKVWNGTVEVDATLKVWNGSAEVAAAIDSIV